MTQLVTSLPEGKETAQVRCVAGSLRMAPCLQTDLIGKEVQREDHEL